MIKKNMLNSLLFLVSMTLFLSCADTNSSEMEANKIAQVKDTTNDITNNKFLFDSLIYEAIENKNFKAYDKVYSSYLWKYRDRELLYYSFIMANKHNCPQACYNIFYSLTFPKNDSIGLKDVDKNTKNLAFHYLLKSYELGHKDSKYTIDKIFGLNPPKSSDFMVFK